jgi:hypothetical protein
VQEKAVAVARVVAAKAAVAVDVAKVMLEDGQARREAHLEAEDPTHLVGANNSAKNRGGGNVAVSAFSQSTRFALRDYPQFRRHQITVWGGRAR